MKDKIGVGLITCSRPEFYKKSATSLLDAVQDLGLEYIVVNDSREKLPFYPPNFIETTGKEGVAKAKNKALRFLLDAGCYHIFLMEDDLQIIDNSVFQKYIDASKATGIRHFNHGMHGNHNLNPDGTPNIRKIVKYPDGTEIDLYPNVLGAFSYYHRSVLEEVGLMDEGYFNALEHVKSTYDISLAGYTSPWRWFVDVHNSSEYLQDIVPDHEKSVIRNDNFQEVFKRGLDRFIEQTGFSVVRGYGPSEPSISESECLKILKEIYNQKDK